MESRPRHARAGRRRAATWPLLGSRRRLVAMRHARTARRQRRHLVAASVLAIALFGGTTVAATYNNLDSNISSQDIETLLGTDRPTLPTPDPSDPNAGQALNILLVGVDDRTGDNAHFGGAGQAGVRSDTVILAHISADRTRVELISIPRDSWVQIPACPLSDGSWSQPREFKFNQAFANGGADGDVGYGVACSIRTLESLTDVRIDGFVAVDFTGFISMIDAIGGVPMCVPEAIDDPDARIQLDAGYQTLNGTQALGFARARKTLSDGSDTSRIGRQQELLSAVIATVLDRNVLTDTGELYRFLDAATASLTTSENLGSLSAMAGLAFSLRESTSQTVQFHTVPWVPRGDGANVLWTVQADQMWERIANDEPIDGEPVSSPPAASPTTPATASAAPASQAGDTPTQNAESATDSPSLDATPPPSETCG